MNSYERLLARIHGQPVDRVPNLCIMMGFAAKYAGIPYEDFCLCPEKMVAANLLVQKDFDLDLVTVMSDPYGEAMDYGMEVVFPHDANPHAKHFFWEDEPTLDSIPLRTAVTGGRMADRVRTIALYADKVKGEIPIAGWVEGAVAEYCDLRNINEAMVDLALEEPFLEEILDRLTEQAIVYLDAQIKAGADIIGIGDAACSLLGPELYRKYGFPYEQRLVNAIHDRGALAKLHICGNTAPLLPDLAKLGADIFDLDWMVDFPDAVKQLQGASAVNGNFDPVAVLQEGTPAQIRQAVMERLAVNSNTTIISAGCEVPRDTPHENLRMVADAIREACVGSPCAI